MTGAGIPWLRPLHWLIWRSPGRRARKLLQFAEVEAEGARDLFRAAELAEDPHLRRRLFAHARDEIRHSLLFRSRGLDLRRSLAVPAPNRGFGDALAPGEHGLDDLEVEKESASSLLAFIHLSEGAAARSFVRYGAVLARDPETRAVIERIARDEEGHMRYSLTELHRVSGGNSRRALWRARRRRLWKAYLRLAALLADRISGIILVMQYFLLLAPFAWAAKRAARKEALGWTPADMASPEQMRRQY